MYIRKNRTPLNRQTSLKMQKRGYHHGNLHQTLMDAALLLIKKELKWLHPILGGQTRRRNIGSGLPTPL